MNNKSVSQGIREEANKNNILGLKINIMNDIVLYSDNTIYQNILDYIEENNIDIFEENDNSDLELMKDEWTENYLGSIRSDLKYNFSKKKLNHFNEVAVYLDKEKVGKQSKGSNDAASGMINDFQQNQKKYNNQTNSDTNQRQYKSNNSNSRDRKSQVYPNNEAMYRIMIILALGAVGLYGFFRIIRNIFD